MMKVLYSSRDNNHVKQFQEWAETILFAAQMGSTEQRIEATATVLNKSTKIVRELLGCHAGPISAVYLIYIGPVNELRKPFQISDSLTPDSMTDLSLYKYGNSTDLSRRLKEHECT